MTVFFIRHGRSTANEKNLYCGQTDVDLSENGVKEILSFREQGIYPSAENALFYSSMLRRTSETMKLIYGDVKYEALSDLNEVNFGDFEMKSHNELLNYPGYSEWINGKFTDFLVPNGESRHEFLTRIENAMKKIIGDMKKEGKETAFVFAHGGVIGTFMEAYYQEHENQYFWLPENGRGFEVEIDEKTLTVKKYKKI